MKISDIIKINMYNLTDRGFLIQGVNNPTAAVITVIADEGDDDTNWIDVNELIEKYIPDESVAIEGDDRLSMNDAIRGLIRLRDVYFNNGGIGLVAKRIYVGDDLVTRIPKSIKGDDTVQGLDTGIINVMLVNEGDPLDPKKYVKIAEGIEDHILLINTPADKISKIAEAGNGFETIDNLYVNAYDTKAVDGSPSTVNEYEVAMVAAYVSKINYASDTIKGLEYTVFRGDTDKLNIMKKVPMPGINIITKLAKRFLIIGAELSNGDVYLGSYFSKVLSQKITESLLQLTINKLSFENATYPMISNAINAELEVFNANGLLDNEFVSENTIRVERKTPAGDELFTTIAEGETLSSGYKVLTLPPTSEDRRTRTYSGVYVYYAIADQIRTFHVSGIALGGI